MGIGSVSVVTVDNLGGTPSECERVMLFVCRSADTGADTQLVAVNTATKLEELGLNSADLKIVELAKSNAKDTNWYAKLLIVDAATVAAYNTAIDAAFALGNLGVEDIVFCDPLTTRQEIIDINTMVANIRTSYNVFTNAHCALALAGGATLAADITAMKTILNGLVAEYVSVTVAYGTNKCADLLGVVIGRLCNPAASLADSPMRVATGSIIGMELPEVSNGVFTMAEIKDLADARVSMPQYYENYDGIYWTDHCQLNSELSDYLVYENRRVIDYLSRRIYAKAVSKVANRVFNETESSIQLHKIEFSKILKDASRSFTMGGVEQPGLILPASTDDVTIAWESKRKVRIDFVARPTACPKEILVSIGLDLSFES